MRRSSSAQKNCPSDRILDFAVPYVNAKNHLGAFERNIDDFDDEELGYIASRTDRYLEDLAWFDTDDEVLVDRMRELIDLDIDCEDD